MGPIEAKRFILDATQIPAISSTAYDNPLNVDLLVAQESVDEEAESNGTTIAQCRPYSKLVSIKGRIILHGLNSGDRYRWMLMKLPDGEAIVSELSDANFHGSNDVQANREIRAMTMAKGMFIASDKLSGNVSLFVKRKTLKRLGSLRENDKIRLIIAKHGAGTANISGFGTLYVRMN